jgi:hypothetical protein
MERRAQRRVQPSGPIRVHILSLGQMAEGTLEDINNAGAFVVTDLELKKGDRVQLEIAIPGEGDTKILPATVARRRAEVRRHKEVLPPGLGVKFVAQTQEDLDYIQQVVMRLLACDLLGQGSKRQYPPGPNDTVSYGRPFYRPDSK